MLSRKLFGGLTLTCARPVGVLAEVRPNSTKADVEVTSDGGEKPEEFRELYLMPRRKLQGQLAVERLTGRAEMPKIPRRDIRDRLSVRRPRREDMRTDQDWTAVWPAAASFRASVVPLPIRMGYRRHVDRRPPFKTVGNLELMKIPNFLHLTPKHIKQHCDAIKKYCTEFPPELKANPELVAEHLPLTVSYSDYVHQGTSLRDNRARIITVSLSASAFKFGDENVHAKEKLRRLLGSRYDESTNSFTITTDRCMTRKQNRDYAYYLLTALYYESLKTEPWEALAERVDDLKVDFEGSATQKHIDEIFEKIAIDASDASKKPSEEKLDDFARKWFDYRNTEETPETVRSYEDSVRNLLGIEKVAK